MIFDPAAPPPHYAPEWVRVMVPAIVVLVGAVIAWLLARLTPHGAAN